MGLLICPRLISIVRAAEYYGISYKKKSQMTFPCGNMQQVGVPGLGFPTANGNLPLSVVFATFYCHCLTVKAEVNQTVNLLQ